VLRAVENYKGRSPFLDFQMLEIEDPRQAGLRNADKGTTYADLKIEGEKQKDQEVEPITSDGDRIARFCVRIVPCGQAYDKPGPSQMPVDVLRDLSGHPQLEGATEWSDLERVFRGLAK